MEIRRCSFVRETKVGLSCMAGTSGPYAYFTSANYKFLLVILGVYDARKTNLMMFFLRPRNDLTWQGNDNIIKYNQ